MSSAIGVLPHPATGGYVVACACGFVSYPQVLGLRIALIAARHGDICPLALEARLS